MTVRHSLALSAAVVLLAACAAGFQATHDHDPSVNFSGYKTYAWISEHPMQVGAVSRVPNPLLERRVMSSIESALAAKGYSRVAQPIAADFVVAFTVGSRDEIRVDSYPAMAGGASWGHPGHYRWGGAYYGTETRVRQYTKGTLAVDIFDVAQRRPVWHGIAEKKISDADREDAVNTINAAVGAILAGFPPQ